MERIKARARIHHLWRANWFWVYTKDSATDTEDLGDTLAAKSLPRPLVLQVSWSKNSKSNGTKLSSQVFPWTCLPPRADRLSVPVASGDAEVLEGPGVRHIPALHTKTYIIPRSLGIRCCQMSGVRDLLRCIALAGLLMLGPATGRSSRCC